MKAPLAAGPLLSCSHQTEPGGGLRAGGFFAPGHCNICINRAVCTANRELLRRARARGKHAPAAARGSGAGKGADHLAPWLTSARARL